MSKKKLCLPIILVLLAAVACALFACSGKKEPQGPTVYGPGEIDPDVVSVTLDTSNAVTVYDIGGDPFDPTGVGLVLHYADGSTKLALTTDEQISVPDLTARGKKKVTVTYGKLSAEYEITVREIEELTVDDASATKRFELNSDFSVGGLKVYAKFFDIEERERIKDGKYSVGGYDMAKRGDQTVSIGYLGKTETYGIRVASKPVELTRAAVSSENDGLYITVGGSVLPEAKYAANEMSLDIQELNTDNYKKVARTGGSVGADGTFEVKGKIESDPENDKPYLVHIILGGDSYDVAALAEPADNTVGKGGRYYRLKSEKAFGNNETLFAVLRNSADIKTLASYEATSVGLVEDGGKPYMEITGTHGNYTDDQIALLQFYFDVQANREAMNDGSNDGNRYLVAHNVALTLGDGATFSVRFDLSALGVYKYTTHFRTGDAMNNDSDNLVCKGKDSYIDVGEKRYKLVFGDPVYWGAVGLEVYDISDPTRIYDIKLDASKAKKQFFIGEKFTAEGLVVTGLRFNGETVALEQGADGYSITAPDMSTAGEKTVTVAYSGMTRTYAVEVSSDPNKVVGLAVEGFKTDYELGEAFSADGIKVYKVMGDGKKVLLSESDYTLTAPSSADMSAPGKKTVSISAGDGLSTEYTVTVWSKPSISGATIAVRDESLVLEIAGTIAGYANPVVKLDLQKLFTDEYIRDIACTPTVDADTGAFTATVNIGSLGLDLNTASTNVGYMIHVLINDDSYDLIDIAAPSDVTVDFGGKHYRLKSECCFENNTSRFVILRAAASADALAPKTLFFHDAAIENNGGSIAVAVGGYFDGIANISDLKLQWRNKNTWGEPINVDTAVNVTGNYFTATVSVPTASLHVGEEAFLWAKLDGVTDSELRNLPGNAQKTSIVTADGRYTLEMKSLFDQKRLITVILEKDCRVTAATLTEEGGKAYLVLTGTVVGVDGSWAPTVDVECTHHWDGKHVVSSAPTVTVDVNGGFTVRQELSSFGMLDSHLGDRLLLHLDTFGANLDIVDLDGFSQASVTVGGKTFVLAQEKIFNGNEHRFVNLTVSNAA